MRRKSSMEHKSEFSNKIKQQANAGWTASENLNMTFSKESSSRITESEDNLSVDKQRAATLRKQLTERNVISFDIQGEGDFDELRIEDISSEASLRETSSDAESAEDFTDKLLD